jgi:hypothetical protein
MLQTALQIIVDVDCGRQPEEHSLKLRTAQGLMAVDVYPLPGMPDAPHKLVGLAILFRMSILFVRSCQYGRPAGAIDSLLARDDLHYQYLGLLRIKLFP